MLDYPDAEQRAAAYEAKGLSVPEALVQPDVMPGYDGWMSVFFELSTDRHIGSMGGVGPIPAASIARAAQDVPHGEHDAFTRIMRALDGAYMARANGEPAAAHDAPVSDNPLRDAFRRGG